MPDGQGGSLVNVNIDLKGIAPVCKSVDKIVAVLSGGIAAVASPPLQILKAWSEGKAQEIRDASEARLADAARKREATRSLTRQRNLDAIAQKALARLPEKIPDMPIDPDWAAKFVKEAEDTSNDELRELWARVLAESIVRPSAIAKRTISTVAELTLDETAAFSRFVSLMWTGPSGQRELVVRLQSRAMISIGECKLDAYGVSFDDCLLLEEAGLLLTRDAVSYGVKFDMRYLDQGPTLIFGGDNLSRHVPFLIPTRAGRELAQVCEPTYRQDYFDECVEFLKVRGVYAGT